MLQTERQSIRAVQVAMDQRSSQLHEAETRCAADSARLDEAKKAVEHDRAALHTAQVI
jgi:hypothetical protein